MKRFILSFVLLFAVGAIYAESGTLTVTSVESTPVTGITVITYDLQTGQIPEKVNETYNISVDVSFDGGDTYTAIEPDHLSGDLEDVSPGTGKQITWDGAASFPNRFSTQTKLRLTATPVNTGIFTDTRDGQNYKWVRIGDQVWMGEDLKYNSAGSWCYDDNDIFLGDYWCDFYGRLYTWAAVMNGAPSSSSNPSGVQGVCPPGWHVPSHDEWTQLEQYVCSQLGNSDCANMFPYDITTRGNLGTNEGNALKSCFQVNSPLGGSCSTSDYPRWAENITNHGFDAVGFSAHAGGFRWESGSFGNIGFVGFWWSATETATQFGNMIWTRQLSYNNGFIARPPVGSGNHNYGYSVRCVKDPD